MAGGGTSLPMPSSSVDHAAASALAAASGPTLAAPSSPSSHMQPTQPNQAQLNTLVRFITPMSRDQRNGKQGAPPASNSIVSPPAASSSSFSASLQLPPPSSASDSVSVSVTSSSLSSSSSPSSQAHLLPPLQPRSIERRRRSLSASASASASGSSAAAAVALADEVSLADSDSAGASASASASASAALNSHSGNSGTPLLATANSVDHANLEPGSLAVEEEISRAMSASPPASTISPSTVRLHVPAPVADATPRGSAHPSLSPSASANDPTAFSSALHSPSSLSSLSSSPRVQPATARSSLLPSASPSLPAAAAADPSELDLLLTSIDEVELEHRYKSLIAHRQQQRNKLLEVAESDVLPPASRPWGSRANGEEEQSSLPGQVSGGNVFGTKKSLMRSSSGLAPSMIRTHSIEEQRILYGKAVVAPHMKPGSHSAPSLDVGPSFRSSRPSLVNVRGMSVSLHGSTRAAPKARLKSGEEEEKEVGVQPSWNALDQQWTSTSSAISNELNDFVVDSSASASGPIDSGEDEPDHVVVQLRSPLVPFMPNENGAPKADSGDDADDGEADGQQAPSSSSSFASLSLSAQPSTYYFQVQIRKLAADLVPHGKEAASSSGSSITTTLPVPASPLSCPLVIGVTTAPVHVSSLPPGAEAPTATSDLNPEDDDGDGDLSMEEKLGSCQIASSVGITSKGLLMRQGQGPMSGVQGLQSLPFQMKDDDDDAEPEPEPAPDSDASAAPTTSDNQEGEAQKQDATNEVQIDVQEDAPSTIIPSPSSDMMDASVWREGDIIGCTIELHPQIPLDPTLASVTSSSSPSPLAPSPNHALVTWHVNGRTIGAVPLPLPIPTITTSTSTSSHSTKLSYNFFPTISLRHAGDEVDFQLGLRDASSNGWNAFDYSMRASHYSTEPSFVQYASPSPEQVRRMYNKWSGTRTLSSTSELISDAWEKLSGDSAAKPELGLVLDQKVWINHPHPHHQQQQQTNTSSVGGNGGREGRGGGSARGNNQIARDRCGSARTTSSSGSSSSSSLPSTRGTSSQSVVVSPPSGNEVSYRLEISKIFPGSASDFAGLRPGDTLWSLTPSRGVAAGRRVRVQQLREVVPIVQASKPGDLLWFEIVRREQVNGVVGNHDERPSSSYAPSSSPSPSRSPRGSPATTHSSSSSSFVLRHYLLPLTLGSKTLSWSKLLPLARWAAMSRGMDEWIGPPVVRPSFVAPSNGIKQSDGSTYSSPPPSYDAVSRQLPWAHAPSSASISTSSRTSGAEHIKALDVALQIESRLDVIYRTFASASSSSSGTSSSSPVISSSASPPGGAAVLPIPTNDVTSTLPSTSLGSCPPSNTIAASAHAQQQPNLPVYLPCYRSVGARMDTFRNHMQRWMQPMTPQEVHRTSALAWNKHSITSSSSSSSLSSSLVLPAPASSPPTPSLKPLTLALHGFLYAPIHGFPDRVVCFCCGSVIHGTKSMRNAATLIETHRKMARLHHHQHNQEQQFQSQAQAQQGENEGVSGGAQLASGCLFLTLYDALSDQLTQQIQASRRFRRWGMKAPAGAPTQQALSSSAAASPPSSSSSARIPLPGEASNQVKSRRFVAPRLSAITQPDGGVVSIDINDTDRDRAQSSSDARQVVPLVGSEGDGGIPSSPPPSYSDSLEARTLPVGEELARANSCEINYYYIPSSTSSSSFSAPSAPSLDRGLSRPSSNGMQPVDPSSMSEAQLLAVLSASVGSALAQAHEDGAQSQQLQDRSQQQRQPVTPVRKHDPTEGLVYHAPGQALPHLCRAGEFTHGSIDLPGRRPLSAMELKLREHGRRRRAGAGGSGGGSGSGERGRLAPFQIEAPMQNPRRRDEENDDEGEPPLEVLRNFFCAGSMCHLIWKIPFFLAVLPFVMVYETVRGIWHGFKWSIVKIWTGVEWVVAKCCMWTILVVEAICCTFLVDTICEPCWRHMFHVCRLFHRHILAPIGRSFLFMWNEMVACVTCICSAIGRVCDWICSKLGRCCDWMCDMIVGCCSWIAQVISGICSALYRTILKPIFSCVRWCWSGLSTAVAKACKATYKALSRLCTLLCNGLSWICEQVWWILSTCCRAMGRCLKATFAPPLRLLKACCVAIGECMEETCRNIGRCFSFVCRMLEACCSWVCTALGNMCKAIGRALNRYIWKPTKWLCLQIYACVSAVVVWTIVKPSKAIWRCISAVSSWIYVSLLAPIGRALSWIAHQIASCIGVIASAVWMVLSALGRGVGAIFSAMYRGILVPVGHAIRSIGQTIAALCRSR